MKAYFINRYGKSDVLTSGDLPEPPLRALAATAAFVSAQNSVGTWDGILIQRKK
jgi:hypothetical protein